MFVFTQWFPCYLKQVWATPFSAKNTFAFFTLCKTARRYEQSLWWSEEKDHIKILTCSAADCV